MLRVPWIVIVAALLLGLAAVPDANARGLTIGFGSDSALIDGSSKANDVWMPRAVREGAGMIRFNVAWSAVAPATRPPGFDPANPASPGYDWTPIDTVVRQLASHGLKVLINVRSAPDWAEGPGRPASVPDGTWDPSPSQFAAFMTAAARRYSGSFPDPADPGANLPRVRYWQPWNEPNLNIYLTPVWRRAGGHLVAASPAIYRNLLNAAYAALKTVSKSNFVVTAGTAPYGDPPGGNRISPIAFDRDLFCLQGAKKLRPLRCPDPPHLDALAHHFYPLGSPLWHAANPDDAGVADEYKVARVLRAAQKAHHALPRGPKRLWVTEVSWDSNPPDPNGVPVDTQALWYEQAMWELWRQGVGTILWLQIVDDPPVPDYAFSVQGGVYYLDGTPKPAATAVRFPFVANRLSPSKIQVWGRAPQGGTLEIRRQRGRGWELVKRIRVRWRQVFLATVRIQGKVVLRAAVGSQTSLPWTQP